MRATDAIDILTDLVEQYDDLRVAFDGVEITKIVHVQPDGPAIQDGDWFEFRGSQL